VKIIEIISRNGANKTRTMSGKTGRHAAMRYTDSQRLNIKRWKKNRMDAAPFVATLVRG
jgi:hypothetical protein